MPHAIVTGAASGMGRLMVERLVKDGWSVAAVDLASPALEELGTHTGVTIHPCDVRDLDQVRTCALATHGPEGKVDRLVTAAGIATIGTIGELSPERFAETVRVNYIGTVAWVHELLPALRESRGQIVLFASLAGWMVTPHYGAYTASKFALVGYGETLAMELKGSGVRVRVVCPPAVRTPMLAGIIADGHDPKKVERSRPLRPERVINAIEKSLRRGRRRTWVFPGPAGIVWRIRRFTPGLVNVAARRLS